MKKLAFGRMGITPEEWGKMTLSDFSYASAGFNELEQERSKFQMIMTRKICWFALRGQITNADGFTEESIIPIPDIDEEITRLRRASLPIAQTIIDGTDGK